MKSSLKEQFARLGQVRAVDRVSSGSPADLVLRPAKTGAPKAVTATLSLAKRGLSLLRAKRAVEAMLERGETVVHVPVVEDITVLARELRAAGIKATLVANAPVDIRELRQRLGMTQEQFALRYNLDLDALRNWEQGRREPDRAVQNYLRVIAREPQAAAEAQEEVV